MKKYSIHILLLVFITCFFSGLSKAYSLSHPWEGSYVSFLEGTAYARSSAARDFGMLESNLPLQPGDELVTLEDSLMEATFAGGVILWINAETVLTIEEIRPEPIFELGTGMLFLRNPAKQEDARLVTVKTLAAAMQIHPQSLVKVSKAENGEISVAVWEGTADVSVANGKIFLEQGQGLLIGSDGRSFYSRAVRLQTSGAFEQWSLQRDTLIKEDHNADYLAEDLIGTASLNDYGDWDYETSIAGYVWRPRVSTSWRPYLYGRWLSHPHGLYWVSYDPWGWTPYHYGRWIRDSWGRWCWVPGYRFAPAWVTFISFGSYYAWAPIGFGGYPYYYPYGTSYYGYPLNIDCDSFVFVHKDCFYHGCGKHSAAENNYKTLKEDDIADQDEITRIGKPLEVIDGRGKSFRFYDKGRDLIQGLRKKIAERVQEHFPLGEVRPLRDRLPDRPGLSGVNAGHEGLRKLKAITSRERPLNKGSLKNRLQAEVRERRGSFTIVHNPKEEQKSAFSERPNTKQRAVPARLQQVQRKSIKVSAPQKSRRVFEVKKPSLKRRVTKNRALADRKLDNSVHTRLKTNARPRVSGATKARGQSVSRPGIATSRNSAAGRTAFSTFK